MSDDWQSARGPSRFHSEEPSGDVEIARVQLRLDNAVQGNGVVAIDRNDRVSVTVIVGGVQDLLGGRKERTPELEYVGQWMEICHCGVADAGEVEHEGVARRQTGQCLIRRTRDDRVVRRRTRIVHDDGAYGPAIIRRRIGNKSSAITVALDVEIGRRVIAGKVDGVDG